MRTVRAFFACLLLLSTSWLGAEPSLPALTGRVVDNADFLSAEKERSIAAQLAEHERRFSDQVVVVTVPRLGGYSIEYFGVELGRHWRIGQEGKDNGVLLIVARKERKVRIEVGYGLEGVLTDALAATVIQGRILPAFKRGDFEQGIQSGVDDILDILSGDAEAVKERADIPLDWESWFKWLVLGWILLSFLLPREFTVFGVPVGRIGGSWSGGGGGFSGGGGSFGGGGASGGW